MEYNDPNDAWWQGRYDPELSDGERLLNGCLHSGLIILAAFVGMVVAALLSGCKQVEYVTVEKVKVDTLLCYSNIRDSIYLRDSVFVKEWMRGETVFVDRAVWHTAIRDRWRVDTVYRSRTDTLVSVTEHVKELKKPLTWWQEARIFVGGLVIFAGIALLVWKFLVPFGRKFI